MKELVLSILVCAPVFAQSCPSGFTQVADTIAGPISAGAASTLFFGDVSIRMATVPLALSTQAFGAQPLSVHVAKGAFNACLAPNDTATPLNTYYRVHFAYTSPDARQGSFAWDEQWSVRTSGGALKIADVRLIVTPSAVFLPSPTGGGGTVAWGTIIGTLGNQADLGAALALKLLASANLADLSSPLTARGNLGLGTAATHAATDFQSAIATGSTAQYFRGDLSLATFPTLAANTTATTHQFFTAYNSATGAFSKGPLACADLSDSSTGCAAALATVATSGAYSDLTGKPTLAAIATSGSAADLITGAVTPARMPALTGDCTTSAGAVAVTCGAAIGRTGNPVSQFASTTSSQLAGVLSDETGTGAAVFAIAPTVISPSLGAGSSPITETWTVGTGGVTVNTLVQTDASAPLKIIASATGAYGVATATASAAGTVDVARFGTVSVITDTGGATAGDLVIQGTGNTTYAKDSGQTASSAISIATRIIGVFRSTATAGNTALVELTPAHFGTLVSGLAANGTNCSAGSYPLGVDASGNAESCTSLAPQKIRAIGYTFDGGGSALSSGVTKYLTVPFGCTITAWNIAVDTGTATIKTWRKATGTAIPTVSDTISTNGVAISTGTAIHSTTVSDFTSTAVAASDIFGINLFAVSGATQLNFILECDQ